MKQFTKESLIAELQAIYARGWIEGMRVGGNDGLVGNTLETLLGITENNLPIPNAAEWELKAQRRGSTSLVTLFHMEPSPIALKLVPSLLLPMYGWPHKSMANEMSFRQTINAVSVSDRGFQVVVNRQEQRIEVSFDATKVGSRHSAWLAKVEREIGLGQLNPQPYWGFNDLEHKIGTKLTNAFFVLADSKKIVSQEYFHYNGILMLKTFSFEKFLEVMEQGLIYVDFDARTGHNHGTKLRLRTQILPLLYAEVTSIIDAPISKADLAKVNLRAIATPAVMREEDLATIEQEEEQEAP